MTEGGSERWRVASGATSLAIHTRTGVDGTVFDIEIGSGDAARTFTATILSCSEDTCVVAIAGQSTVVRLAPQESGYHAMVDGESFTSSIAAAASTEPREGGGPVAGKTSAAADLDALCAPMPATVSAILVQPGAVVSADDTLVRLEAMKMEMAVRAPCAGRVTTIDCRVGDLVQPGRPLVTLDPDRSTRPNETHEA